MTPGRAKNWTRSGRGVVADAGDGAWRSAPPGGSTARSTGPAVDGRSTRSGRSIPSAWGVTVSLPAEGTGGHEGRPHGPDGQEEKVAARVPRSIPEANPQGVGEGGSGEDSGEEGEGAREMVDGHDDPAEHEEEEEDPVGEAEGRF